jgi:uncharacterized protein
MRAFAWFLGAVLLAGLIGAGLAYPAYQLTAMFADFAFHRVASRIAMLLLIVELIWLCRHLKLTRKRDFGYGLPWRRFLKMALLFGLVGMISAGVGAAFLLSTHLRIVDPSFAPSTLNVLRIFAIGVGSGIAVAVLEETVIRGAMHSAIERESGPWIATLLTASLYAILHFFAKVRIPAAELGFGSGFDLLVRSFAIWSHPALIFDAFLAWLVVGLILSLTRVLTGNIAVAIGLHAGWVVVLRMLQQSTVTGSAPEYSMWVGSFDGLLGYWMLPWGICVAAALWLTRNVWAPPARQAPQPSV